MKKISRIINVCLNDECADQDDYLERYGILKDVINGICAEWEPFNLDAIVFPGGFWHRTKYIGNRDYKYRKESLEKETFTKKSNNTRNDNTYGTIHIICILCSGSYRK